MAEGTTWEDHRTSKQAERRLAFFRKLQDVTNRIHSTENIEQIMTEMARDICFLFGSDRLTLYAVTPCKTAIETRIKTGLDSFRNFVLPIANSSVAGHVALTRRSFNIRNVYDLEELQSLSRDLRFMDKVDRKSGYRSREMIAAPIVDAGSGELLGVLQLINNRLGGPFLPLIEEGVQELCKTLAVAFAQRMKPTVTVHTRFDPLVVLGTLAYPELELAKRSARRKQLPLEDVLLDEFQVAPEDLGAAYAQFFDVPYEPFARERQRAPQLASFARDYVEHSGWLVLEDSGQTLVILSTDPDRLRASKIMQELFPGYDIQYRVTTQREFMKTVGVLYDGATAPAAPHDEDETVLARLHRIIGAALAAEAPDLQATVLAEYSHILRNSTPETGSDQASQAVLRIALRIA